MCVCVCVGVCVGVWVGGWVGVVETGSLVRMEWIKRWKVQIWGQVNNQSHLCLTFLVISVVLSEHAEIACEQ